MVPARVKESVGGLNLRETPAKDGPIVDTAAPGDIVEVIQRNSSGWALVKYKGQRGWMWGADLIDVPVEPLPYRESPKKHFGLPQGYITWILVLAGVLLFILAVTFS